MDDIVEKLREMAAIKTSALYSQRRTLNRGADRIEALERETDSLRSENSRLGELAKALSAIIDAPDQAEAIIDIIADRDSWRDQCVLRDADNARLAKERDAAFAMSKCECGADEACANLARLAKELEEAREAAAQTAEECDISMGLIIGGPDGASIARRQIAAAIRHKAIGGDHG